MKNDTPFVRGDVIELNISRAEDFSKAEKALLKLAPYSLVVLRKLEDGNLLVSMCRNRVGNHTVCLQTLSSPLYAHIKQFYSVNPQNVSKNCQKLSSPYNAVSEIYNEHNKWIEKSKAKREKKKQERQQEKEENKRKQKAHQRAKIKKRKEEEHYEKLYEISAINNDRKQMQKIIKKVGYVPYRGKGGTTVSRIKKATPIYVNPKPLNGGRFSPK